MRAAFLFSWIAVRLKAKVLDELGRLVGDLAMAHAFIEQFGSSLYEPERPSGDEAQTIAVNIAKLPVLMDQTKPLFRCWPGPTVARWKRRSAGGHHG
jgi:hypothetical protein